METIIITGGLGFIGSNLINILKDKQTLWEQIVRIIQHAKLRNP